MEIKVIRDTDNRVVAGVFQELDGSYSWLTYSRSGTCKKLATAMKKCRFEEVEADD